MIFFQKYNDEIYLTTPRFLPGVPSALNKVVSIDDVPTLQPFPNLEMQEPGNNFTISTYINVYIKDTKFPTPGIIPFLPAVNVLYNILKFVSVSKERYLHN